MCKKILCETEVKLSLTKILTLNIFYYHILEKQKNKIKMVVLIFLRRLHVQLRWRTPLVLNALQVSSETLLGQNKEQFEL